MNRIYTRRGLTVFVLIFLFFGADISAEEETVEKDVQALGGLSGRVVDLEGNGVAGFIFAVQPMQLQDNMLGPEDRFSDASQEPSESMDPRTESKVQTDSDGAFVVSNIQPGLVQLGAGPNIPLDKLEMLDNMYNSEEFPSMEEIPHELMRLSWRRPDRRIISIQVGKVTFFNEGDPDFSEGLTFAIEPGVTIENVKITVKQRLRIRGKVIYPDGTPLADAQGRLDMDQRHEFRPNHGGSTGTNFFTDADGYFVQYMDEPGFYTVSVEYKDLTAGVGPFLLKDGVQPEEIVFTLESKPVAVALPADDIPAPGNIEFREPVEPPPAKSVWVINPTNGHAYKRIQCENWDDAQRKAVEEGAHLVSINDEAEQHWLQVIFGGPPFWIGLTDVEKEGEWQWDSGEPFTYTNWTTREIHPDRLSDDDKDYVVFTFMQGGWQSVGPGSPFWRMARRAVIEKDGLLSNIK